MSATDTQQTEVHTAAERSDPELLGILAEFNSAEQLVGAAKQMKAGGVRIRDAYSPFPLHGVDDLLEIQPSRLPWLVLFAGVTGGFLALLGIWWTGAVDYPLMISGKPLFSLPSSVPVTFEVIILCSALAAFFGTFALAGLPRYSNPLHRVQGFDRVTSDGFFLLLEASSGGSADSLRTRASLAGALSVRNVTADAGSDRPPKAVYATLAIAASLALLPPLWIAKARSTTSDKPPLRSFKDMDFQAKRKAQTRSAFFADGRAMRPAVAGTVARGEFQDDDSVYLGFTELPATTPVSAMKDDPAAPTETPGEMQGIDSAEPAWVDKIPVAVSDELMRRGKTRYQTFCAACHGRAGDGDGPVAVRATELQQGTWVPPTSLHADHVRKQPDGKLYHTVTNGIRKMPGYSDTMSPEDRWAVVLYVRAIQRTRTGTAQDLTPAEIAKLRDLK